MAKYIKVYKIGGFSQTPNAQTARPQAEIAVWQKALFEIGVIWSGCEKTQIILGSCQPNCTDKLFSMSFNTNS